MQHTSSSKSKNSQTHSNSVVFVLQVKSNSSRFSFAFSFVFFSRNWQICRMILNMFSKIELKYYLFFKCLILVFFQNNFQHLKEQKLRRDNFSRNTVASCLTTKPAISNSKFLLSFKKKTNTQLLFS